MASGQVKQAPLATNRLRGGREKKVEDGVWGRLCVGVSRSWVPVGCDPAAGGVVGLGDALRDVGSIESKEDKAVVNNDTPGDPKVPSNS